MGRRRLGPIEVRGATHLEAALAEHRGLLLISGHFGVPALIRLVLEERGLRVVGVGGVMSDPVDVRIGGDVWTGARSTQQIRMRWRIGMRACF